MQEYTVNIKRRSTSLPLLSILEDSQRKNFVLHRTQFSLVYNTISVTSSGIFYNRQMAEGTEP